MTPHAEEARRLLSLAQADRDAFNWLVQGPGLRPATVYFSAQQSVEKLLKAVMLTHNLPPTRTHDVLALAAQLNEQGVATPLSPEALAILNPYAVTFRYDDEVLNITSPQEISRIVETMLAWAQQHILQS